MEPTHICINGVFTAKQKELFKELPTKGQQLTLREEVKSLIDGKIGWLFHELHNDYHPNGQEYSFRPSRFVPIDSAVKEIRELLKEDICH